MKRNASPDEKRKYFRDYYADRRARGICSRCPNETNQMLCEECKAHRKGTRQQHRDRGLCGTCGNPLDGKSTHRCKECLKKERDADVPFRQELALTQKERRDANRALVFAHYGNRCACCGEPELGFLSIDHKNAGRYGEKKHLTKTEKGRQCGTNLYSWIIRSGFPDDLQLLCMNCNHGRGRRNAGGICPHKRREQLFPEYVI